jgi:hypothetical protein
MGSTPSKRPFENEHWCRQLTFWRNFRERDFAGLTKNHDKMRQKNEMKDMIAANIRPLFQFRGVVNVSFDC